MPLENYYSGDDAFTNFASTPDAELDTRMAAWPGREQLIDMCKGDALLARAIFYVALTSALEYMVTPIPALNHRTPAACVKSVKGLKRLKECLMRTP